jgi:hypothetical protein
MIVDVFGFSLMSPTCVVRAYQLAGKLAHPSLDS